MRIPFFNIEFTKEMKEAAINSLQNEKFVLGESVFKFEEEFARYIDTKYAVSVNSGNSALHLSLLSLGINQNHKVITSTNSFIASSNCILMCDAKPILCDIFENDGNMDITTFTENFDAIIPVHIYGNPCDYDSIAAISEEKKIPIIEDAAQAHGATFGNKKIGSLGTVGCFSFYTTKNMTVGGDGGMITTDNEEIAEKIQSLRDNGRTKDRNEHDKLGFTMRLNTINAAIGRTQLRHLDENNAKRREICNLYRKHLINDCILPENPNGKSVFHQIVLKSTNRDEIIQHLTHNEIGTSIHYPIPIHKQLLYSNFDFKLPKSEKFCNEILSLPSYPTLKKDEVRYVCEKLNEVLS